MQSSSSQNNILEEYVHVWVFFPDFSFFFSPKDVAVLDTQYITFCGIILFRKMCKQYKFDGNMQMSGNKTACAKVEEHRQQISIL